MRYDNLYGITYDVDAVMEGRWVDGLLLFSGSERRMGVSIDKNGFCLCSIMCL